MLLSPLNCTPCCLGLLSRGRLKLTLLRDESKNELLVILGDSAFRRAFLSAAYPAISFGRGVFLSSGVKMRATDGGMACRIALTRSS